jgi:DNA invertase Pin-like site-specific DNA recombinase
MSQRKSKGVRGRRNSSTAMYVRSSDRGGTISVVFQIQLLLSHRKAQALLYLNGNPVLLFVDLGKPAGTGSGRPAFEKLLASIKSGKIGAVFVSDPTRISRNATECLSFVRLCVDRAVPIILGGEILDPARVNQVGATA